MANAVTARCTHCDHAEAFATSGFAVRLPDGTYYPLPPRQRLDALRHLGLDPTRVRARHGVMRWTLWRCTRCGHRFERYFAWAPTSCAGCSLLLLAPALACWLLPWSWPLSGPLGLIVGTALLTLGSKRAQARADAARPDLPTPADCPRCEHPDTHRLEARRGPDPCPSCGAEALHYARLRTPQPESDA